MGTQTRSSTAPHGSGAPNPKRFWGQEALQKGTERGRDWQRSSVPGLAHGPALGVGAAHPLRAPSPKKSLPSPHRHPQTQPRPPCGFPAPFGAVLRSGCSGWDFKNASTSGMFLAPGPSPAPALVNERGRKGAGASPGPPSPAAALPAPPSPCAPLAHRFSPPHSPSGPFLALFPPPPLPPILSPVPLGFVVPPLELPGGPFASGSISLLHHLLHQLIPPNPQVTRAGSSPHGKHPAPSLGAPTSPPPALCSPSPPAAPPLQRGTAASRASPSCPAQGWPLGAPGDLAGLGAAPPRHGRLPSRL